MNKTVMKDKMSRYWLVAAVIIAAIVRELMIKGLPINAMPGAACDDQLLKSWAYSILAGEWTDSFNSYTFTKEVGFSIFLAVCYRLHISYLLGISLVYTSGVIVFAYALRKIVIRKLPWFLIYVVLLFHPISYAFSTVQRVYRNGLGLALTLWIFGSILNLYFTILEESFWQPAIWAFFTGASLGFLWIVKRDTIWLMPFVVVVLLVMAGLLLFRRRKWSSLVRVTLLLLPFAGIWICLGFVSFMNIRTYGCNGVEYYGLAFANMTGTKQDKKVDNCSMTTATFEHLCEMSPTLDSIKDAVLNSINCFDRYDTNPQDGNLEDGWLGWAFLSAVEKSGYYKDGQTANSFYKKIYDELEAAYDSGELQRKTQNKLVSYHADTPEKREELIATIGQIFHYVASENDVECGENIATGEEMNSVLSFENITGNSALYTIEETDYYLRGWIFYPGYQLERLKVQIEDEIGNKYASLIFDSSTDIEALYPEEWGTGNCRFQVQWDERADTKDTVYYICAYDNNELISKVKFSKTGFVSENESTYLGSVDSYLIRVEQEVNLEKAHRVVTRMNHVADIYKALAPWIIRGGMVLYLLFTLAFLFDLKKKRFEDVNAWLVITGIMLSLLILFFGIAVVHLEQCPAIGVMYLSSGYALLLAAMLVSIYKCVERIVILIKKYKK